MLRLATLLLAAAVTVTGARAGEAARIGDLVVESPWARASIGTSRPGVAYLTMRNEGAEPDTLVGIETPAAGMAEVHETTTSADGVSSMAPAGPVEIPPGASVALAPGGLHAMLMQLREPLVEGESFPLTLSFAKAGSVEVRVPVLGMAALGPPE